MNQRIKLPPSYQTRSEDLPESKSTLLHLTLSAPNDGMADQLRDASAAIEVLKAQVRAYELLHGALEPEDFVSLKAATVTGLKYEKIRRLAAAEKVASRFQGKHRRVSLKSLRAWLAQHSRGR